MTQGPVQPELLPWGRLCTSVFVLLAKLDWTFVAVSLLRQGCPAVRGRRSSVPSICVQWCRCHHQSLLAANLGLGRLVQAKVLG